NMAADEQSGILIRVNATDVGEASWRYSSANAVTVPVGPILQELSAGDEVDIAVENGAGSTAITIASSDRAHFTITEFPISSLRLAGLRLATADDPGLLSYYNEFSDTSTQPGAGEGGTATGIR